MHKSTEIVLKAMGDHSEPVGPTYLSLEIADWTEDGRWAYNTNKMCYHLRKLVKQGLVKTAPCPTGGNYYQITGKGLSCSKKIVLW